MVWCCVGVVFPVFVIFQRVRRPTYPQDIHFSGISCCVTVAPVFVASVAFRGRNRVRQGNVMMPDLVLRSHRALASDLGSAFRFHTQLPQHVDVPEIRSDALGRTVDDRMFVAVSAVDFR